MSQRLPARNPGVVLRWGQRRFYLDTLLMSAAFGLLLLGFIMMSSASLNEGEKLADSFFYAKRQFAHIVLGCFAACAAACIRLETWRKCALAFFLIGLVLLTLVWAPGLGKEANGSHRWLHVFGVDVQISEVFKLIAIVYVASYISRHYQTVRSSMMGMVCPLALLSIAAILLLLEPDYGATAVIMATALGMLFLGGARLWQFGLILGAAVLSGFVLIQSEGYRLRRVVSYWNPWDDPLDSDFQLSHALIAFGRGEWTGVGLGSGMQKMGYLPEAHTDFLFSVIGEELGLFGALLVIVLFTIVVWRALVIGQIAERQGLRFAAFLSYGIGIWFGLQAFINMGVNMGVLPTKGLTLPLMSYGGGSMIVTCAALALLLRIRSEAIELRLGAPKIGSTWTRV